MLTGKGKIAAVVLGLTLCQGGASVRPACAAETVTDIQAAETHILAALDQNTTVEFIDDLAKLAAKYGSDVYPDRDPSGPAPGPACQSADSGGESPKKK